MPIRCRSLAYLLVISTVAAGRASGQEGAAEAAQVATERCYEMVQSGAKVGFSRVVWAPSTWQERATVHDRTIMVSRSARDMLGLIDVYETTTTIDLERDEDGTLWSMRVSTQESERTTTSELTFTEKGYTYVESLDEAEESFLVPTAVPVPTDIEAWLGAMIRRRALEVGAELELPTLDLRARRVRNLEVTVEAREKLAAAEGEVESFRVRQRDPISGSEMVIWLDDDGAYVKLVDGALVHQRAPREQAESLPATPPVFSITVAAEPRLERVFAADRLEVDIYLQDDESRPLPVFPDSPWSKVGKAEELEGGGWRLPAHLTAYAGTGLDAALPLETKGFERDLESTALITASDARIVELARRTIKGQTTARGAALALSLAVNRIITRGTPDVAELSALEILDTGQGDCSEHALLFTALCRAVGIPTRRVSGFVCIGSEWGAHSWCEIWVGEWIGADPTTNDIGTAARYLCYGYPDRADSFPGLVSSSVAQRMRLVTTELEEDGVVVDLRDPSSAYVLDDKTGAGLHHLAGIATAPPPPRWRVRFAGENRCTVRGPGVNASLTLFADQGTLSLPVYGEKGTFAGQEAIVSDEEEADGGRSISYLIHTRRRFARLEVTIAAGTEHEAALATLAEILAPTFAATLNPPPPAESPAAEGSSDAEK